MRSVLCAVSCDAVFCDAVFCDAVLLESLLPDSGFCWGEATRNRVMVEFFWNAVAGSFAEFRYVAGAFERPQKRDALAILLFCIMDAGRNKWLIRMLGHCL